MQGNRDDRVKHRARKVLVEVRDGEIKQWLPEVHPAVVFELMNRLPQRAFIPSHGAGMIEWGWCGATGPTAILGTVPQGHGRPERFPATGAVWRLDQADQVPTAVTECSTPRGGEGASAMIAVLREDDIQHLATKVA